MVQTAPPVSSKGAGPTSSGWGISTSATTGGEARIQTRVLGLQTLCFGLLPVWCSPKFTETLDPGPEPGAGGRPGRTRRVMGGPPPALPQQGQYPEQGASLTLLPGHLLLLPSPALLPCTCPLPASGSGCELAPCLSGTFPLTHLGEAASEGISCPLLLHLSTGHPSLLAFTPSIFLQWCRSVVTSPVLPPLPDSPLGAVLWVPHPVSRHPVQSQLDRGCVCYRVSMLVLDL